MSPDTHLTIDERVTEVVVSLCPIDAPLLTDDLLLTGDLGFDSLGLLELVSALEVEFDLTEVPEEEALEIETVGDLRALLAASTAS
jgi:acyl carrier protein